MMKAQEQVTVGGVKHTFRANADGSFTYKAGTSAPKKLNPQAAAPKLDALRVKREAQDRKAAAARAKAKAQADAAKAKSKAQAERAKAAAKAKAVAKPVAKKTTAKPAAKPVAKKVIKKK